MITPITNLSEVIAYIAAIDGRIEFRMNDTETINLIKVVLDEDLPMIIEQVVSAAVMKQFAGSPSLLDTEIVDCVKRLEEANRGESKFAEQET